MQGEKDLRRLLANMTPILQPGVFVFCTQPDSDPLPDCQPLALFHETEGVTLILKKENAERLSLPYSYPSRCITLRIHSDLEAVGLLAAVTKCLAEARISCNVFSAFFHDHLFVPEQVADRALALLTYLQEDSSKLK